MLVKAYLLINIISNTSLEKARWKYSEIVPSSLHYRCSLFPSLYLVQI